MAKITLSRKDGKFTVDDSENFEKNVVDSATYNEYVEQMKAGHDEILNVFTRLKKEGLAFYRPVEDSSIQTIIVVQNKNKSYKIIADNGTMHGVKVDVDDELVIYTTKKEAINNIAENMKGAAKETLKKTQERIETVAKDVMDKVEPTINKVAEKIEPARKTAKGIGTLAGALLEELADAANRKIEEAKGRINEVVNESNEGNDDETIEVGRDKIAALRSHVKAMQMKVMEFNDELRNLNEEIKEILK